MLVKKRKQLWLAGAISSIAYGFLCWRSQAYGDASLSDLLTTAIVCFLASIYVWNLFRHEQNTPIIDIVLFALAFRFLGLFTFPVLEDDFYRYLWDGFVTIDQGSPYGTPPSDWFNREVPSPVESLLDTINYPDVSTVYGPTLQWLFALSYMIAPGELWPLKCMLLLADVALMLALLRLAPARHLVLYAWSPLVIKEFVISMHPDLIGACLLVLALLAYRSRSDWTMGALLALAAGVKVFAFVIVPFLLLLKWRAWLSLVVTAIIIALPFGLLSAWLPDGLAAMGQLWLFNAPLYELFGSLTTFTNLKIIFVSIFVACGGVYGFKWLLAHWRHDSRGKLPRGDILFAGLLIILPAFNPWYMIWLLPFAVIRPSIWAWVASFTLILSYASGINLPANLSADLQDYQHPNWLLILEFGLIAFALVWDIWVGRFKR